MVISNISEITYRDEYMNEEEIRRINELAQSVLKLSRNTLVIHLRFMDTAISRLNWISLPELIANQPEFLPLTGCGLLTEGTHIIYDPLVLCRMYAIEKENGPRTYLHMVLHCVFRHFLISPAVNQPLWDLACDMAVENVISRLDIPALNTSCISKQNAELRRIEPEVNHLLTAEKIYHWLQAASKTETELRRLKDLFFSDDHDIWYMRNATVKTAGNTGSGNRQDRSAPETGSDENDGNNREGPADQNGNDGMNGAAEGSGKTGEGASSAARTALEQDWRDIAEHMQMDMETFSRQQGDQAGDMMQNLREVNREKYDYVSFLKKFAVMGEAMKINDDEFDYIFYTYGMKLFPERRMPLIEPLEYKEVKRIREFVIAIDTSGSVAGDKVQSFLQKTYNVLKSTESFFSRINLHIIQCDAEIREDQKITNQEEFDDYLAHMKIKGLGGTDFRPVFRRVDEMVRQHEFSNLKGLIYFTDGYGTFPEHMPAYKTAFVFVRDGYEIPEVPVWAMRLILQKDEIQG